MQIRTRKMFDRSLSGFGVFSIILMALALLVFLAPIVWKGMGAFCFQSTVEYRKFQLKQYGRGDSLKLQQEIATTDKVRRPLYEMYLQCQDDLAAGKYDSLANYDQLQDGLKDISDNLHALFGPIPDAVLAEHGYRDLQANPNPEADSTLKSYLPRLAAIAPGNATLDSLHTDLNALLTAESGQLGDDGGIAETMRSQAIFLDNTLQRISDEAPTDIPADSLMTLEALHSELTSRFAPILVRETVLMTSDAFGRTRWDAVARDKAHQIMFRDEWDYSQTADSSGVLVSHVRAQDFAGTALEPFFPYFEAHLKEMLSPRRTFSLHFLFDDPIDAHLLGGIWPEMLGTFYLTLGAILFAIPFGVIAAIYLSEFAPERRWVGILRTFINTLAGVPSIVFGLFGLAFFINTLHVSENKSILAGSMTLALLILPTIIRASEEAIRAVPMTFREASLSLGASKLYTVARVIIPAALPGILTGIVISMGRAAGETAPIIFTAAVSVGQPLKLWQTISQGSPALSWNIYNLATEHARIAEIRHVQYGMVLTLIAMVMALNLAAIIARARIAKKLRG